jgi:hypothetical protein
VLSMVSGLGFAATSEYLDQSVRGSRGVSLLLGAPPIVSIPYIDIESGAARLSHNRTTMIGAVVLTILILGLLMMQVFWSTPS